MQKFSFKSVKNILNQNIKDFGEMIKIISGPELKINLLINDWDHLSAEITEKEFSGKLINTTVFFDNDTCALKILFEGHGKRIFKMYAETGITNDVVEEMKKDIHQYITKGIIPVGAK